MIDTRKLCMLICVAFCFMACGEDDVDTCLRDWYFDADGDGYGDPDSSFEACIAPSSYVHRAGDCNDNNAAISPVSYELCNGRDDNCDGEVDENDAIDAIVWYHDADGDGFGAPNSSALRSCDYYPGEGWAQSSGDCDDSRSDIHPDAYERCDGIDNDCDGEVDSARCPPIPPPSSYRFIAIVSASPEKAAPHPGPDIDGVEVTRGGAAQAVSALAKAVAGQQDRGNTKADYSSVLVADAKKSDGSCDLSDAAATFYSMGSNGSPTGFLILDMGPMFKFASGDQIKVIELAKTNCNNITTDSSDRYEVFLCESADATSARDIEAGCLSLGQSSVKGGEFTSTVQ